MNPNIESNGADGLLETLQKLAIHIVDSYGEWEDSELWHVPDRIVDELQVAFDLIERETGRPVPAARFLDEIRAAKAAPEPEEDEDDEFIGPMLRSQLDFTWGPRMTEPQLNVIQDVMVAAANYVDAQSDDQALLDSVPVLSALERSRRMLYATGVETPHEVESILTRHYRLLLDHALDNLDETAH